MDTDYNSYISSDKSISVLKTKEEGALLEFVILLINYFGRNKYASDTIFDNWPS